MYLSIFDEAEKVAVEGLTIDPASLYSAFEQVADGRKKRGTSYPLPLLLTLVLFQPIPNWPVVPVTPEYFVKAGLTEEEAHAQDELGEKLTTFHRIRAGGYTYRVFPEENE